MASTGAPNARTRHASKARAAHVIAHRCASKARVQNRIMTRSTKDGVLREKAPLRLRIPASLAVALVGASATIAMSFGGCQQSTPDPIDAGGPIDRVRDAGADDTGPDDGPDSDGGIDGQLADAAVPTPDAPAPADAALPPPDAPVG